MARRTALTAAGVLLAVMLAPGGISVAHARVAHEVDTGPTRFQRLIDRVAAGSEAEQAAFARIAVEEMLFEYEGALESAARTTPRTARDRGKQYRWTRATRGYLSELEAIAALIGSGEVPVAVTRSAEGSAYLRYGNRLVVVGSMNLARPRALEAGIVETYCAGFDCTALDAQGDLGSALRSPVAAWSFGDRVVSFETADGLRFEFADLAERGRRQAVCETVAEDFRDLAERLLRAAAGGHLIEWEVVAFSRRNPDRLVINRAGAFLRASGNSLARLPDVLARGRPWLRARLAGRRHAQSFPRAEVALAPVLAP